MPAGHVATLDDYWVWLEQLIEQSGGYLPSDVLVVEAVEGGPGQLGALIVPRQRLHYHDGSYLSFELSVLGATLEQLAYSYHYARPDDALVWRLDKHDGHTEELGQDTHIHIPPDGRRRVHDEVEMSDVLEKIREDQGRWPGDATTVPELTPGS